MWQHLAYIFIGGGLGSLLRFFFTKWFNPYFLQFPFGTFLANVTSSFIVGLVVSLSFFKPESNTYRYFIVTGICGGFSTFSGFSNETMLLFRSGTHDAALLNIGLNVVVCLIAVWVGMKTAGILNSQF